MPQTVRKPNELGNAVDSKEKCCSSGTSLARAEGPSRTQARLIQVDPNKMCPPPLSRGWPARTKLGQALGHLTTAGQTLPAGGGSKGYPASGGYRCSKG